MIQRSYSQNPVMCMQWGPAATLLVPALNAIGVVETTTATSVGSNMNYAEPVVRKATFPVSAKAREKGIRFRVSVTRTRVKVARNASRHGNSRDIKCTRWINRMQSPIMIVILACMPWLFTTIPVNQTPQSMYKYSWMVKAVKWNLIQDQQLPLCLTQNIKNCWVICHWRKHLYCWRRIPVRKLFPRARSH